MAQKFGGKFSPNGPTDAVRGGKASAPQVGGAKVTLLFFAPLPLLYQAFLALTSGKTVDLISLAGAFVILELAAWLLREGLKAETAFDVRKSARRPAFPRKIFASVFSGIGIAVAVFLSAGAGAALGIGALGAALHSFAFGFDPLKNKGMDGFDELANERVAKAVEAAEQTVTAIISAIQKIGDRGLEDRVANFAETAREMFRTVENDPRDLTSARKYLGVYLRGARDATIKFSDLYTNNRDPDIRADYEALLSDLEANFDARRAELMLDDQTDLDIEIEVLRERLAAEGIAAPTREQ